MFKSQIPNPKSQIISKFQSPNNQTRRFGYYKIGYWLLFGYCLLVIGVYPLYAQDASKEEEALFVARRAFEDGFYDVSLGLLERFLKNYPASAKTQDAELLIGQCYFHQNKFLDALKKFQELLGREEAKNIKDAVLYWMAEVHFRGNDFSKAREYYQKIIDGFPNSPYLAAAYYSLGWCLFQERTYDGALNYFKIAEEKFPKEAQAQDSSFKVIECLYNLKDYTGLKEKIKSYLKAYPKDTARLSYLYFYWAEADYYLNNFTEAIEEYAKVISTCQDDKVKELSRLGMGWAYLKLKQYKAAEDTFNQANVENLEKRNQEALLLGKAILMFETERFNEAKNIYQELLSTSSDPVVVSQGYLGKADALYQLAEYKEAMAVYTEALEKIGSATTSPQEIIDKLHYGRAWSLLKESEFKEAINEFQRIVKYTEDKTVKVSTLCHIADTYQDLGNYEQAIQTYDSVLKDYPDSLYSDYVQYQLGLTLLKASNYNGAVMAFQNLKVKFPNSKLLDDASYALGLAYFQKEDYSLGKEIFEKFQDEFKDSNLKPQALYLLGSSLYNLGKFNEAIAVFNNIIKIYNQDTELVQKAEYEIADCYYQMGDEKEAMARFKLLRTKYPDSRLTPEVMWWLGEYYYRHSQLNLARRYFSSLIQDFPKSDLITSCYYALGSTYAEEEKYEEAVSNFQKVTELDKSDLAGTAATAIADIYVKQDNIDLALKKYKEVLASYPNLKALIYPKIARAYSKINDYAQALDFYRQSLEVVPVKEMADIQFNIAEVLQAQEKTPEAIEEYLKVTYLYEENSALVAKALLRVAAIYENKENFKEALSIYKRIAAMNVQEAKYAKERIDFITTHNK